MIGGVSPLYLSVPLLVDKKLKPLLRIDGLEVESNTLYIFSLPLVLGINIEKMEKVWL